MQFDDLALDHRLLKSLAHLNLTEPTEIQQQAIPAALKGQDLIASSRTGSGKTLAFLLPALHRLMRQKALSKRDPRVLVLAPTRELANQVYAQLRSLVAGTQFTSARIVGGENFNDQAKALRRDPHLIVATPGRLANHLDERSLHLAGLELLILDEADRMLDLGFADQLRQINAAANHRHRQTLMFSATLEDAEVNELASELLSAPQRIAVGSAHEQHEDIRQRFYLVDHLDHKQALLLALLNSEQPKQAIIFTATRGDTDRLAALLREQGLDTVALSGEVNQAQRNQIMDQFSRGHQQVLITTDLASRGLDLLNVSHVFNFDMPKHAEEYVHRIGRTGRAGFKGDAISLVGPKDWAAFKRVEAFLQLRISFSVVDGLEAKFKGLKPKPKARPQSRTEAKAERPLPKEAAAKSSQAVQRRRRKPADAAEQGFAPMKRKKQDS
ncbi:DEAD/DEAH box helicase [Marinobacterium arenosum]|uniref:DEAD/DEAH box helicase n=1 Tax=Marinobacterium arenosum TaxID=2862496 RepID=UPI001C94242D|nr:DEAD/DEAH box helicase [Marinobacterium arenosum]MBY4677326.1 DEAD/DEAH box helicase [Marinobacterium arenosum]